MTPRSTLPLHDPTQWPLRMTRADVAHVLRCDRSTLYLRIKRHLFPPPDLDRMWPRATVQRYAEGNIQEFGRQAKRTARTMARAGRKLRVAAVGTQLVTDVQRQRDEGEAPA